MQPERSVPVEVEVISTHEKEKQLVKYTGNKQTTNILLPSRNVESYTKTKPVTQSDYYDLWPIWKEITFSTRKIERAFWKQ